MSQGFRIGALTPALARKSFSSGRTPLDRYLHDLATQDIKRRVSNCFVALDDAGVIAGYYTFAAASFPAHGIVRRRNEALAALRAPIPPA